MSDALGTVNYDPEPRNKFLDISIGPERGAYAEETARLIDAEVKRIMTDAHDAARRILTRKPRRSRAGHPPPSRTEVMEGDELARFFACPRRRRGIAREDPPAAGHSLTTMNQPAYAVARTVAPTVAEHLRLYRAALPPSPADRPLELLPTAKQIEALVDTAFWASVRREEGYVPKISLAFLGPLPDVWPLTFATPLPLEPSALTRLAAAVEQPGNHLGVRRPPRRTLRVTPLPLGRPVRATSRYGERRITFRRSVSSWRSLSRACWCCKHRPRHESRKFVNLAVLEGDRSRSSTNGPPSSSTALLC